MASIASQTFTCAAPAKINLTLHVTGLRADGYHQLESLVVFCQIADRLTLTLSKGQAKPPQLDFSGPFGETLKAESDNLVPRACEAFLTACDHDQDKNNIHFHLEKSLPLSSGMGGGSADAAAALLCLSEAFGKLAPDTLAEIATGLGADVPMCLSSLPLIAKGVGEHIEPLKNFPNLHMVLVNSGKPVATPKVFAALTHRNNAPMTALPHEVSLASLTDWLGEQRNDLQAAAISLVPEIAQTLDVLDATGAAFTRMSGSGATCFGLYADAATAQSAGETIAAAHPDWWVQATTTQAFGLNRVKVN